MSEPEYKSEAFHTGFEAHERGEPRKANPHGWGTWDHEEWYKGWDEAAPSRIPDSMLYSAGSLTKRQAE
jgi:hypothetical protein